jgi:hypothetical protein
MTDYRHFSPIFVLCAALVIHGCGSSSGGRGDTDSGVDPIVGDSDGGGDGDGDSVGGDGDGDGDSDDEDAGPASGSDAGPGGGDECIPKGCDEQGFECGIADDGCGGELDCDPPGGGDPCTGFEICGGNPDLGPNKCGCKPKTCDDIVEGGAFCGVNIPDGCGGVIEHCGAGGCEDLGANYVCADDFTQCRCIPVSETDACAGKQCGVVSNGCGEDITCGTCSAFKTCGANSACACDMSEAKRKQACGNTTCGTVTTPDGCVYTCGPACTSTCASGGACGASASCTCPGAETCVSGSCCRPKTKAEACGAQNCGSVSDGCGGTIQCGDNNGGCPSGQTCADPTYNNDANVPMCLPTDQARLLGKYVVRAHSYRNATEGNTAVLSRSETISLVTITRQGGKLVMDDEGCVASSVDEKGGNPTLAPYYYRIPRVRATLQLPGADGKAGTWLRISERTPGGFYNARPPFCSAAGQLTNENAPDFDAVAFDGLNTPTPGSGAKKPWLNGSACTCPAAGADVTALPAQNTTANQTVVKDCRVNDIDGDGRPGFTVSARALSFDLTVTAASYVKPRWDGFVDAAGRHYAYNADAENRAAPVERVFLSCYNPVLNLGCSAIGSVKDWGCGKAYDITQFVRLTGSDVNLSCLDFYKTKTPSKHGDQDQNLINARFGAVPGSSCTTHAQCRETEICRDGACRPMTTPGACNTNADCRSGWRCADDKACWPASCPKP